MSWLIFILLCIIIFLFVELGIYLFKTIREYLLSKRIQDTSDYRSFVCGEIVWYDGIKYRVGFVKTYSDDHRVTLGLYYVDGDSYWSDDEVDSVYVKKVQRVYTEVVSE